MYHSLKWFSKSCPKFSRGARLPACEWQATKSKREAAENAEGFAEKYLDWTILIRHSSHHKLSACDNSLPAAYSIYGKHGYLYR